jgi:riboflavin transporter FmnP
MKNRVYKGELVVNIYSQNLQKLPFNLLIPGFSSILTSFSYYVIASYIKTY